ncbi:hypothetical protein J3A65_002199 [Rhizobium sp. PvP014]|nr:hypothetical protein [Rhizobium sp. PvP014]MBP2528831.1 hypothetical protein [Rhizobium sp. PvP099]
MQFELVHEVWLDPEADGQMLPGLCLAGPMGDGFRSVLNEGACKVGEIRGSSTFDLMIKYWKLQGWGKYTTSFEQDHEPFPEEWISIQQSYLRGRVAT